ncbi:hypothetical protein A0H81_11434 [Grifola frondosa]|uniref:F-box domain-containing protein n=1 Tax=Grifola frondosa TaxID=5627 RepID=A0A1C7LUA7_GRIFR|nr:hypothetical protein A0H81_11434 [Grifola frondosa]
MIRGPNDRDTKRWRQNSSVYIRQHGRLATALILLVTSSSITYNRLLPHNANNSTHQFPPSQTPPPAGNHITRARRDVEAIRPDFQTTGPNPGARVELISGEHASKQSQLLTSLGSTSRALYKASVSFTWRTLPSLIPLICTLPDAKEIKDSDGRVVNVNFRRPLVHDVNYARYAFYAKHIKVLNGGLPRGHISRRTLRNLVSLGLLQRKMFPRLESISWDPNDINFFDSPFLTMFIGSSTERITCQTLREVNVVAPRLISVARMPWPDFHYKCVDDYRAGTEANHEVMNMISRYPLLREFAAEPCFHLRVDNIIPLAEMSHITFLRLDVTTSQLDAVIRRFSPRSAFPSPGAPHIRVPTLNDDTRTFLRVIGSPRMTELELVVTEQPPAQDIEHLLEDLVNEDEHNRVLRKLRLIFETLPNSATDEHIITAHTFRSLPRLVQLNEFVINAARLCLGPAIWDRPDFKLPNLRSLSISSPLWGDYEQMEMYHLPINQLPSLVQRCPNLESLTIPLNVKDVPQSSPKPHVRCTRLTVSNTYTSNYEPVAKFIAHLFPSLTSVCGVYSQKTCMRVCHYGPSLDPWLEIGRRCRKIRL